jgi:long-chain fatty acid transport protein
MRKKLLLITGLVSLASFAFGGGIVTNSNQSAAYVRTLVRDASTDADAVYFNPAGLARMKDGFHFSLNNQTIFQSKDVTNNYQFLNDSPKKYKGEIKVPVFPDLYAVWKKNKFAVSFGFNPIGGGGGAEYKEGLPSFETQLSDLKPTLQGSLASLDAALALDQPAGYGFDPMFRNVTGYSADIYFKGSSIFFGYQLGASYKINEIISVFAGLRYVSAKNTYEGHIYDIKISASPTQPPSSQLYTIPAMPCTPGNYLRAVAGAYGLPGTIKATLEGTASYLDLQTADREVNAEETGNGFTPILGANISLGEKLNVGIKYEFKTKLDLTTDIIDGKDGGGMFIQDSTVHSDMPAMFSVGALYKILSDLRATVGFHYYFDKNANYGKTLDLTGEPVSNDKVIDKNYFEIGAGLEYDITAKLLVSAGYLLAKTGVTEDYQSDASFSLTSNAVGFGFGYKFTNKLMVNLGGLYSMYNEGEKNYTWTIGGIGATVPVKDTFYKNAMIFSIGLDISF